MATQHHLIRPGVVLLAGFALAVRQVLHEGIEQVSQQAGFRHMRVPGGHTMSVAMTNCGRLGWVADTNGYRYRETDPLTEQSWPPMPDAFRNLAIQASLAAGFDGFSPDVCLINRYEPGSKLSLHRDIDEVDFSHPIVSVSLGSPARFVVGGLARQDPSEALMLYDGDVLVWGGEARMIHHAAGSPRRRRGQPTMRWNLTFRRAGA